MPKRPQVKKLHQPESELPPGIALAWGRVTSRRRGPRPGYTLEEIVKTAIKLADKDGISALSLPSIAARLGLSRNALYRYVRSKEELLMVIYDAAWGSPPRSLFRTESWRKGARVWTLAVIRGYRERLWLLDVPITGSPATPHVLMWLEALLQSLTHSGLNAQDCLRCALLLDGYARSVVRLSRDVDAGAQTQKQSDAINTFLLPLLQQRRYPTLASIMTGGQYAFEESPVDDIEFGLNCILVGIDRLIADRKRMP
jgi:AcrR family transcriptional regulator